MRITRKLQNNIMFFLTLLNVLVLLGQLLPAAAPPFARLVNIAFLVSTLVFFIYMLLKKYL